MSGVAGGVWFGWDPLWVATALLIVTYAVIMTERINRAVVALFGAALTMWLDNRPNLPDPRIEVYC